MRVPSYPSFRSGWPDQSCQNENSTFTQYCPGRLVFSLLYVQLQYMHGSGGFSTRTLFSSVLLYSFWITSRSRKKMSGYFQYVNYFWRTWPQTMNKSVIYFLTKENMILRRWAISVLSRHQWNTKSLKIKNKDLFLSSTLFNYPQGIDERLFPVNLAPSAYPRENGRGARHTSHTLRDL